MTNSKAKKTAATPYGTFTRITASDYTHICVSEPVHRRDYYINGWVNVPVSGAAEWLQYNASAKGGVFGRYVKDRGYVVSWHKTEAAARKALADGNSPYIQTRPVGVYPVAGER